MRNDLKTAIQGAVLVLALGAGGCLDGTSTEAPQVEEKSSPIIGGTVTTSRPEVGSFVDYPEGTGGCTATLIGNQEIMTASHCISLQGSNPSWSVPGFQQKNSANNQVWFQVDFANTDCPNFCPGAPTCNGTIDTLCCDTTQPPHGICAEDFNVDRLFPFGTTLGANDIAVGHLTEGAAWATESIASIATGAIPINTYLTVVGYGCDARVHHDFGLKRFLTYFYNGGSTSNYCEGDSGGPTFQGQLNDGGAIVRLVSGSSAKPFYNDIGADPIVNRSAITAMVAAMDGANISYRPQMQTQGFQSPAASDGAQIGSTTLGLRMEAVQVWSPQAGITPFYRAYTQNFGWGTDPEPAGHGWQQDGVLAGTVGQNLRMEAFEMFIDASVGGWTDVQYRAWIHGATSWQPWIRGNQTCTQSSSNCPVCAPDGFCAVGTTGQSKSIEAMEIQLVM